MTVALGVLLLSTLLAQTATPAPAPAATTAPGAAQSSDDYVRRGPATAPRMRGPQSGDATIANSGSTNTAGYTVVVHPDFSADVSAGGATERKTVDARRARRLFATLRAAMPLGDLPAGRCMKSASFGSVTTIAYGGQTTPDLSCGGGTTLRDLARAANAVVEQLHLALRPSRGRLVR
ncbi:MAG: hypothetical protein NVS3B16_14910 [Vulcanimicrobiaceae bacterium]